MIKVILPMFLTFVSVGSCYHDYQHYKIKELRRMKNKISFTEILSKGGKLAELSVTRKSEKTELRIIEREEIKDIGELLITEGKQSQPGFFPFTIWNGSYREILGEGVSLISELPAKTTKDGFKKLVAYV
jgi:hypothetical protein